MSSPSVAITVVLAGESVAITVVLAGDGDGDAVVSFLGLLGETAGIIDSAVRVQKRPPVPDVHSYWETGPNIVCATL